MRIVLMNGSRRFGKSVHEDGDAVLVTEHRIVFTADGDLPNHSAVGSDSLKIQIQCARC